MEYNSILGYQQEITPKDYQSRVSESLIIHPDAARRVRDRRNYEKLKLKYNQLQSEYNRLQRTRAMRLIRWLTQHPKFSAGLILAYDKVTWLLGKKQDSITNHKPH